MSVDRFDPRIRAWFAARFGAPTEVQRLAWGPIADGRHVLLTAPTGSGKTLTAFLWALEQLATGTVLRTLLSRGLIEEVGRKEQAGRPALYGTSIAFLQQFGLADLNELPALNGHETSVNGHR